jgi:hypothetical protein
MSHKIKKEKIHKCINSKVWQYTIIIAKNQKGNCDCHYESDCKKSIKDCEFDKSTCLKRRAKRKRKGKTPWGLVTVIIGITLLAILYVYHEKITKQPLLLEISTGLLVSIIAAGLFTHIIDMPSRLRQNLQSIIDTITDNSYLKELDERQLSKLRKQVTKELHAKDAPNATDDLIHIDERICKLLKKPYYERYEHIIVSNDYSGDNAFREKQVSIYYELVNPCGEHRPTSEYIGFQILVFKDESVSEPIKNIRIECNIDGQGYENYSDRIEADISPLDKEVDYYNHLVTMIGKEDVINPDRTKNGLKIDYRDRIIVKMSYTMIFPKEDNYFSKLMRHPTKSLLIDYTDHSSDVELVGHMIGTELEYSDVGVTYRGKDRNSLMLNSHDKWLLPNEGVLIVASPKKNR